MRIISTNIFPHLSNPWLNSNSSEDVNASNENEHFKLAWSFDYFIFTQFMKPIDKFATVHLFTMLKHFILRLVLKDDNYSAELFD